MQEDRAFVCRLIDVYGDLLSERQRDVVDLYYNEDLSLAEISENCGITRQGVRDAIIHGVAALREYEKKLGFASKTEKIAVLASKISSAEDISEAKRLAEAITGEL